MRLADLRARGAFVDPAPVRHKITWRRLDEHGQSVEDEFFVHVRRQSFALINRLAKSRDDDDQTPSAMLIAESIRLGDDATEKMSVDQAMALDPNLAAALMTAIVDVNGLGSDSKN